MNLLPPHCSERNYMPVRHWVNWVYTEIKNYLIFSNYSKINQLFLFRKRTVNKIAQIKTIIRINNSLW